MPPRSRIRTVAQLLGVLTLATTVVTGEAHSNHAAAIKHAFADVPLLVVIEAADSAHKLWDELHQAGVCAPADRCRRVKVPSMAAEVGRDATSVMYQLDGEALVKFYATEYDRPTMIGLVTDLARVVGHLRALQIVGQGEGYGVVLEEGRVDVSRGIGWACYTADRLADVVADVQSRDLDWRVVQLAYDIDRIQLVGDLMSLRINGTRSIRRRPCGPHTYVTGTGAYAITPAAAVDLYKASSVPQNAGSAREQFDLRRVVDGTAASLLYPRSHVHMSTCPAFPVLPLESTGATALLLSVQRKRLLQAQEGNKDASTQSSRSGPSKEVRSVRSEYLFVANHLDKRDKVLGCWMPIEQRELSSSVAHLLCRLSHGAPSPPCVAYAQARVRAFLDLCANGCQDEEEADPRMYDSGLFFHDGRFVRVDWRPTHAHSTLHAFLRSLRPSSSDGDAIAESPAEAGILQEAARIDRLEQRALSRALETLPLTHTLSNGEEEGRRLRLEVFYLVGCEGRYWRDIVQEQLWEVQDTSGFLEAVDGVHVIAQGSQAFSLPWEGGKNGSFPNSNSEGREWTKEERAKFDVTHLGEEGWAQFEFPALTRLWGFCASEEGRGAHVLYMHSKGAQSAAGGLKNLQVATDWRQLMSYFTVRRFRECVALLQAGKYDSCGPQLVLRQNEPHYSGNFWWSSCDYVRTLPDPRSLNWTDRLEAEMWLGRGKDWRPANCYRSSVYYKQHYGRREYEDHMGCGWMLPLSIMPPETEGLGIAVA